MVPVQGLMKYERELDQYRITNESKTFYIREAI